MLEPQSDDDVTEPVIVWTPPDFTTPDPETLGWAAPVTPEVSDLPPEPMQEATFMQEAPSAPEVTEHARQPSPAEPAVPAEPVVTRRATLPVLLVVEDNGDTRLLLDRLLSDHFCVTTVGDARAALEHLNAGKYDALVLDINLGGKQTGVDVLRVARQLPGYDTVFAVALTAYALPGDRERFVAAGFDRYVSKPFTRGTLMEALQEVQDSKAAA